MSATRSSADSSSERTAAIDAVIAAARSFQPTDDARVLAAHAELMPELGQKLQKVRRVDAARRAAEVAAADSSVVSDALAQALAADVEPPAVQIVGYTILRKVDQGGQGIVYLAIQLNTGRKVAVKVMRGGALDDERSLSRFKEEIKILAGLNHPNIVGILNTGQTGDGRHFIAMDYIAGWGLAEYMRHRHETDPDPKTLLRLFVIICDAMNAAHLEKIAHRDLKPGNIRVDERGDPHILDFGLAKSQFDSIPQDGTEPVSVPKGYVGSSPWFSPEHAEGKRNKIDIRSDVYSLGVILYQILTGRFPYEVLGNPGDILKNILTTAPTPPSKLVSPVRKQQQTPTDGPRHWPSGVDADIEKIVLKALAKKPTDRYQTAGELGGEVAIYLDSRKSRFRDYGLPSRFRQILPVIGVSALAVALLVFIAVGVSHLLHNRALRNAPNRVGAGPTTVNSTDTSTAMTSPTTAMGLLPAPVQFPIPWAKPGIFASLRGTGEIEFPKIALPWYVIEIEMDLTAAGGKVDFRFADGDTQTDLAVGWDETLSKNVSILSWNTGRGGKHWKDGEKISALGQRLKYTVYATVEAQLYVFENGVRIHQVPRRPMDLALHITTNALTQGTIYRCVVRKFDAADAKLLQVREPPPAILTIDTHPAEVRLSNRKTAVPVSPDFHQNRFIIKTIGTVMQRIDAGEFVMGSPLAIDAAENGDEPRHPVRITRPFWIGQYPVTQGAWTKMGFTNPSAVQGSPYLPVDNLSWQDAMKYCAAVTATEQAAGRIPPGYIYRLPTEAEWEYTCRAGSDNEFTATANDFWSIETSGGRPHEVGEKAPNRWGVFDMHGGVEEWCLDARNKYPTSTDVVVDPYTPGKPPTDQFVMRGGAWCSARELCRCGRREFHQSIAAPGRGFRIVLGPINDAQLLAAQRVELEDAERVTATSDHPEKIDLDRAPTAVRASLLLAAGGDKSKLFFVNRYRDKAGKVIFQCNIPNADDTSHMVQFLPDGRLLYEGTFTSDGKPAPATLPAD